MKIKSKGHLKVKTVINFETIFTIHNMDKVLLSRNREVVLLLFRTTNRDQPDLKIRIFKKIYVMFVSACVCIC